MTREDEIPTGMWSHSKLAEDNARLLKENLLLTEKIEQLREALGEMLANRHYGYTPEQIERWYETLQGGNE